jgi:hypothetical protein
LFSFFFSWFSGRPLAVGTALALGKNLESGGGDLEIGEKEEGEGEAALPLRGSSPTNSCVSATSSSLYASTDKFYSDAESDDEYKDPLPESYQQQHYQVGGH